MRSVDRGILANLLGNTWVALMAIVFSPLYIKYIGIEAFGLIGVFSTLQALTALFDLGVGRTITHEVIRFRSGHRSAQSIRDLQFTLAIGYFLTAVFVVLFLFLSASWLSRHWLNLGDLPHTDAKAALRLAAVVIGLRWLCGVHRSMLSGTSDLVWVNASAAMFATLRGVGAVGVAVYVSSSVQAYFVFHLLLTGCELVAMMVRVHHTLPPAPLRAHVSLDSLRPIWRFSAGATAIAVVSAISMQLDKVALSRLLPLKEFGYYAFGAALAGSVHMLFYSTSQAHAQFAAFVEQRQRHALVDAFHRCCQMIAILLMPACVVLCLFADQVIMLWGLDARTVAASSTVVSLLVVGALLKGLMTPPYALQLAHGKTRTFLWLSVATLAAYVPLLWIGVQLAGTRGAAAAWAAVNFLYVVVGAPTLLRVLPPIERWRWLKQDVLVPLAVIITIAGTFRAFISEAALEGQAASAACMVLLAAIGSFAGASVSTPTGRQLIRELGNALRWKINVWLGPSLLARMKSTIARLRETRLI